MIWVADLVVADQEVELAKARATRIMILNAATWPRRQLGELSVGSTLLHLIGEHLPLRWLPKET